MNTPWRGNRTDFMCKSPGTGGCVVGPYWKTRLEWGKELALVEGMNREMSRIEEYLRGGIEA